MGRRDDFQKKIEILENLQLVIPAIALTIIAALLAGLIICIPTTYTVSAETAVTDVEQNYDTTFNFKVPELYLPAHVVPETEEVEEMNEEVISEEYFLTGIDISQNQGNVDAEKTSSEVGFAVIRVGYSGYKNGKCVLDSRFYELVDKFATTDVKIALYWASHSISVEDVARENEFILEALAEVPVEIQEKITYFFIDREDVGKTNSRTYLIDRDVFNNVLGEQIRTLEVLLPEHMQVGVYTNRGDLVYKFDSEIIGDVPYWVAWWCPAGTDTTSFDALFESVEERNADAAEYLERNIVMWQYSNKGVVDGITDNVVDLNVVSSKVLY